MNLETPRDGGHSDAFEVVSPAPDMRIPGSTTLQLVDGHRLHDALGEPASAFLPVSGICLVEGACYLVFRDRRDVVRCRVEPPHPSRTLRWFRQAPCPALPGYAGVTFDPVLRRFYALVAAFPGADGTCRPAVDAYDDSWRFVERRTVDFPVTAKHPGFVALAWTAYAGQDALFMLCGGYKCRRGKAGHKPGGGRIHVFRPGTARWEHVRRINLPKSLQFDGVVGMDLLGDRLLVVARDAPLVWVGQLAAGSLDLTGDGGVYELPHDDDGDPLLGTVTSAAWLGHDRILAVTGGSTPQLHVLSLPA